MKILMLTPYLPFPLWSGGQIRSYNLIKNLSSNHQITLFSFIRENQEKKFIPELKKFCQDIKLFVKRPPFSWESLAISAVSKYPLVVCMYLKKSFRETIAKSLKEQHFDLIHAETFYVMPNIPQNSIPTILAEQTIEYLVYHHHTEAVSNLPQKLVMKWDVAKIRYWERNFWQRATRVIAMSQADKRLMQQLVPSLSVDLVPNGVDAEHFQPMKIKQRRKKTILFVGNFKWLQNREAVSELVNEIWPKIINNLPRASLWIVGKFPTEEILNYRSSSIKVSSDIDDIRSAYQKSDVLLAPIYGPGGTRYKILEAMASGIPVVTTSTGIEGLDATEGRDVLVRNDPKSLADATVSLLTNKDLYKKLVKNGRELIEDKYNWQKIAKVLDGIYQQAAYGTKI